MKKILTLLIIATTMTSCFYDCVQTTYRNGAFYNEYRYSPDAEYGCECRESTYIDDSGVYTTLCTTD
tara:strand:- start:1465 stop:1665 length:201 start_codon:yes stop_codon:yes gene_type:complete